jgi:hypothetical protein
MPAPHLLKHEKTPPVIRGRSVRQFGRSIGARRQAEQPLAEVCRWPGAKVIRRTSTAGLCPIASSDVKTRLLGRTRRDDARVIAASTSFHPRA